MKTQAIIEVRKPVKCEKCGEIIAWALVNPAQRLNFEIPNEIISFITDFNSAAGGVKMLPENELIDTYKFVYTNEWGNNKLNYNGEEKLFLRFSKVENECRTKKILGRRKIEFTLVVYSSIKCSKCNKISLEKVDKEILMFNADPFILKFLNGRKGFENNRVEVTFEDLISYFLLIGKFIKSESKNALDIIKKLDRLKQETAKDDVSLIMCIDQGLHRKRFQK